MHSVDKWLDGKELEQDEVNRAATMREKTLQITEKQQAEIERLKDEIRKFERYPVIVGVGNNCLVLTKSLDDYEAFIGNVSAEAYKEFAERLKKRLERKYSMYGREYVLRHIRELVKEMTEGSNGE